MPSSESNAKGVNELNLEEIHIKAKERFGGVCRVCRICDGAVCAGQIPGIGGLGTGESFQANLKALARYRLNLRTIHPHSDPDPGVELFGLKLALPVMAAPVAGARINFQDRIGEKALASYCLEGSISAGTIGMTGDGPLPEVFDQGLEAITDAGGKGIPVIKPREQAAVIERIHRAEQAGAVAFGVDIDAAGLINMTRRGQKVGPKTVDELRELAECTRLPLVLKGIMTADEAELAASAGVYAIVVSNHGGRALDHTPGTAEVLPEIAATVKGRVKILADGGIRSGADVLKMLALGADAVLVGRPLTIAAFGCGAEGVRLQLEQYADELKAAMILTGCPDVASAGQHLLRG